MTERSDTMPVIGRLDDQVEAILINPLKRRRAEGVEERRADGAEESADGAEGRRADGAEGRRAQGAEERARTAIPTPATGEQDDADSAARKRVADDDAALPVWLL
jgi:hypothetical protein